MPEVVTIANGDAERAEVLLDPICRLYDEVFSASPFRWSEDESEHHRGMLSRLITEPTFGIATAEAAGRLVGFAYGYTLTPATRWWQNFHQPLPADVSQEWQDRTFALIDLAVEAAWRGQGIGRRLVQCLLDDRSEERATLSVQPTAVDAQAFYARLGWQKVGRKEMPPGAVSPQFDVYVADLGAKP